MTTPAYWRQLKIVRSTASDFEQAAKAVTATGWTLLTEHCSRADDGTVRLVFGRQDRHVQGAH